MPRIEVDHDDVCSLEEFCAFVDASPERVVDIAHWPELWTKFRALGNNRSLLTDLIHHELEDPDSFQRGNRYSGQTFIVARNPGYYIRANVWPPTLAPGAEATEEHFNRFYVYGERYAHDHNFDFLTVGYYGPGYVTDIYSYDNTHVKGEVGEPVQLHSEGRHVLEEGVMLLFRQGRDIHVQHPPDALTISLNFIPDVAPALTQYMFDVETSTIANMAFVGNRRAHMELLVAELGDDETKRIYRDWAK